MDTFKPTHTIRWTPRGGKTNSFSVMLVEDEPGAGGPAYDVAEWENGDDAPCWARDADGVWTCLGRATPGGANGTVEITAV